LPSLGQNQSGINFRIALTKKLDVPIAIAIPH
jgi:hypothetical protein